MHLTMFFIRRSFVEPFVALVTCEPPDSGVDRHMRIPRSTQCKNLWAVIALVLDTGMFIHVKFVVSTVLYSHFTLVTVEVESPCVSLHVPRKTSFMIVLFVTSGTTVLFTHIRCPHLAIDYFT